MSQSHKDLFNLVRKSRPSGRLLSIAAGLSLASALLLLTYPLFTQLLVDSLGKQGWVHWGWLAAGMIVALVAGTALGGVSSIILARVGQDVSFWLRRTVLDKMIGLPVGFFDAGSTGDRTSRITSDCASISQIASAEAISLVNGIIMLIGSVIILLWLDHSMTIVLMGTLLTAFICIGPAVAKLESVSREVQERSAELSGLVTQIFSEIRLVKSFAAESHEVERGTRAIQSVKERNYAAAKLRVALEIIIGVGVAATLVVVLVYGGHRVATGEMSIGILTAFILYIFNVVNPLTQIASFIAELQRAKGASGRITAILQLSDERDSDSRGRPPQTGILSFEGVSFAYPSAGNERGALVLKDVSFSIDVGSTLAIVGESGGGKSTILSLMERFYETTEGSITYGGKDIREFDLSTWREMVGYVPQSCAVMPGTVRDNIAYGLRRKVTDAEILEAAGKARALDFIEALPAGLDTILSEQGSNISGGQRQRIAIARIFLRDPAILLLDEATSSLDGETEQLVKVAIDSLMEGRTNIVVTHRITTVLNARVICHLHAGRVSALGSHEDLFANKDGGYARLAQVFMKDLVS